MVPYTEEVGRSAVDTLLQIASVDSLRSHIPTDSWSWLSNRPPLPTICLGRRVGSQKDVVHQVRELGDVEILKSYFLLVWSEWDSIHDSGFYAMCTSIREDFGGIGMGHHREDLVKRLDHIIGELDRGLAYISLHNLNTDLDYIQLTRGEYRKFRDVLLEVGREAVENPACTSFRLINIFELTDPRGYIQSPT